MTYPDDVVEKALDACSPEWRMKDKVGQFLARTQMRHALAAAESAMWRPIETAPEDGTPIILLYDLPGLSDYHARIVICHWSKNCGGRWVFNQRAAFGYSTKYQPKLWAPLPTPPAASTGRG